MRPDTAIVLLVAAGAAWWLASIVAGTLTMRALERVRDIPPDAHGERLPSVSIVVAARDEAASIDLVFESFRGLDWPDAELVLVDDRSGDGTGDRMDEAAAADPRIRALHVTEVPDGWLGKVNALERGREVAGGAWLWFVDADVEFHPRLLLHAFPVLERDRLDHLALLPQVRADGVLVAATVACFSRWLVGGGRLWRAADPDAPYAFGVGACNLVRAELLARAGGLGWLRMDLADDAALGQLVLREGGRSRLASGVGLVRVRWQESVRAMTRGFEKYGSSGGIGTLPRTLALVTLGAGGELALPAGLVLALLAGQSAVAALAAAAYVVVVLATWLLGRRAGAPARGLIALPVAPALVWWMQVRAALLEARRGGVMWRDTFYDTATVRAGKRYRLGRAARP